MEMMRAGGVNAAAASRIDSSSMNFIIFSLLIAVKVPPTVDFDRCEMMCAFVRKKEENSKWFKQIQMKMMSSLDLWTMI